MRHLPLTALLAAGLALAPAAVAAAEPETDRDTPISLEADADSGDPFAQFVAGRRELVRAANAHDPTLARVGLQYLARSAEAGFAPAARFAGSVFLTGEYVDRDVTQAMAWFERAAELGDADSQRLLGDIYADGDIVPRDLKRAVGLYETYVENPGARDEPTELWETAYRLGVLHARGTGTPANADRARVLWTRAAAEGRYPPAMEALAEADILEAPEAAVAAYLDAARAYLQVGLRYEIDPEAARANARRILAEMQRLDPDHKAVRRLETELAELEAMGRKVPRSAPSWARS